MLSTVCPELRFQISVVSDTPGAGVAVPVIRIVPFAPASCVCAPAKGTSARQSSRTATGESGRMLRQNDMASDSQLQGLA